MLLYIINIFSQVLILSSYGLFYGLKNKLMYHHNTYCYIIYFFFKFRFIRIYSILERGIRYLILIFKRYYYVRECVLCI